MKSKRRRRGITHTRGVRTGNQLVFHLDCVSYYAIHTKGSCVCVCVCVCTVGGYINIPDHMFSSQEC